ALTFPLAGNDYNHPPCPPWILNDVVSVELRMARMGDGDFGPPLAGITYHVDNFRLSGSDLWETFDGPGLGWRGDGDRGTNAGVGHNQPHSGAGSLVLRWRYARSANIAAAATNVLA